MSRSSRIYARAKEKRLMKQQIIENKIKNGCVLKFNEAEDFLDFNNFGPVEGEVETVEMTLDEFVNLPIFNTENSQKALLCIKNNEICNLATDEEEVTLTSLDDQSVNVKYGDIEIDFDKNDIISAFQEKIDAAINENIKEELEMPSVLKFKEFLELEKLEAKQNGKDKF